MEDRLAPQANDPALAQRSRWLVIGIAGYAIVYAVFTGIGYFVPNYFQFEKVLGIVWAATLFGFPTLGAGIVVVELAGILIFGEPPFSGISIAISLAILGACMLPYYFFVLPGWVRV